MSLHKDYIKEERERMEFFFGYLVVIDVLAFVLIGLVIWLSC